ncbi:MAG: hypothetical protein ACAI34_02275 [Verrucomicrobium sp.]
MIRIFLLLVLTSSLHAQGHGSLVAIVSPFALAENVLVTSQLTVDDGVCDVDAFGKTAAASQVMGELLKFRWSPVESPLTKGPMGTGISGRVVFGIGESRLTVNFLGTSFVRISTVDKDSWFECQYSEAWFAQALVTIFTGEDKSLRKPWEFINVNPQR